MAGGNGWGKARNRGIDPNTGEIVDHTVGGTSRMGDEITDGRYHRVKGLPLSTACSVPDDRLGRSNLIQPATCSADSTRPTIESLRLHLGGR